MKVPTLFDKIVVPVEIGDRFIAQMDRLNGNLERLLEHLGAPLLASPEERAMVSGTPAFAREPLNELELALKEHAELTGQQWNRGDES